MSRLQIRAELRSPTVRICPKNPRYYFGASEAASFWKRGSFRSGSNIGSSRRSLLHRHAFARHPLKAGLPVEHLVLVATWPKSGSHLRRPGKGGARVGGSRDPPSRTHVPANHGAGRLLKARRRGEVSARAA